MSKIYKLMINNEQINDVYYYACDAIAEAAEVVVDTSEPVEIWVAEDIKDVPLDKLKWYLRMEDE